jgi:hypothetical protein
MSRSFLDRTLHKNSLTRPGAPVYSTARTKRENSPIQAPDDLHLASYRMTKRNKIGYSLQVPEGIVKPVPERRLLTKTPISD